MEREAGAITCVRCGTVLEPRDMSGKQHAG